MTRLRDCVRGARAKIICSNNLHFAPEKIPGVSSPQLRPTGDSLNNRSFPTGDTMKISRAILGATLLTASAVYAATRPAPSQDVVKVAGDSHTVIFENDQVRVLAVHFKPGQVAPRHSHPASVSYFLTDGRLKITLPDGKVIERSPKAGTAGWSDAVTHTAENIGTTDFQQVQIELKTLVAK
jgi:beta-alanine degradation protein BauB